METNRCKERENVKPRESTKRIGRGSQLRNNPSKSAVNLRASLDASLLKEDGETHLSFQKESSCLPLRLSCDFGTAYTTFESKMFDERLKVLTERLKDPITVVYIGSIADSSSSSQTRMRHRYHDILASDLRSHFLTRARRSTSLRGFPDDVSPTKSSRSGTPVRAKPIGSSVEESPTSKMKSKKKSKKTLIN